jgi:flagellar basal body-associated protein FliL
MAVNTIILILVMFIAVMAIVAWLFDKWRNQDDDDDWEPYG